MPSGPTVIVMVSMPVVGAGGIDVEIRLLGTYDIPDGAGISVHGDATEAEETDVDCEGSPLAENTVSASSHTLCAGAENGCGCATKVLTDGQVTGD